MREEEVFVVLAGRLSVRELERGASATRTFDLEPGDIVVYPPGTGLAHHFVNRSKLPARFLALSDHAPAEVAVYADSGKVLVRALKTVGVLTGRPPGTRDPIAPTAVAADEAIAKSVATSRTRPNVELARADRPGHVLGLDAVPERALGRAGSAFYGRALSRAAGARTIFVNHDRLPPGSRTPDLHCHLRDEELVLVLSGHPTLRQRRGRRDEHGRVVFDDAAGDERVDLAPGDCVHWAPGDLVTHQLVNDGADDAAVLVIGTDRPDDVLLLPDRGEIYVAAIDLIGPLEATDYWAGESPHATS